MPLFTPLRHAFRFAPLFGRLITTFGGSNIVTAVFAIAGLIRQFFAEKREFDQLDDLGVAIIDQVPAELVERYGADHVREAILHAARMMEQLHLGKEAIRAQVKN